jgi:hypothetical protein
MPAPVVYAVTPTRLAAAGGHPMQIVGRDLDLTLSITIGGAPPNPITRVSNYLTNCTAPPHAVGTVDVVVNNSSGTVTAVGAVTFV